jgi:hypothetical protein
MTFHGGFLSDPGPSGGTRQLNAAAISFSEGTQVGVLINSEIVTKPYLTVMDAYNISWLPVAE